MLCVLTAVHVNQTREEADDGSVNARMAGVDVAAEGRYLVGITKHKYLCYQLTCIKCITPALSVFSTALPVKKIPKRK
jgi:hypothetical protein